MRSTLKISGYECDGKTISKQKTFYVSVNSDKTGSTLNIDNGKVMYSIPFEKVIRLLVDWDTYARN